MCDLSRLVVSWQWSLKTGFTVLLAWCHLHDLCVATGRNENTLVYAFQGGLSDKLQSVKLKSMFGKSRDGQGSDRDELFSEEEEIHNMNSV